MKGTLFILITLVGLSTACTTTKVHESVRAQIKRVAVVSLFPSEIDTHQIGLLPIIHESRIAQVHEWDAHAITVAIASRLLRAQGYDVIVMDARASLPALPVLPDVPTAVAPFLASARDLNADAIVVVAPGRMRGNGPTFYSIYFVPSNLFGMKTVWGGCVSTVHVFGASGELLARSIDNKSFDEMPGISWREAWSEYSKEERKAIYMRLETITEENLQWKLHKVL